MLKIEEIEFNFSNRCTANCAMCSSAHGYYKTKRNMEHMHDDVFYKSVEEIKKIDFEIIQTSGNGDCFTNPNFIKYLRILRKEFPNKQIWNFSNFYLYDKNISDIIIGENLIDKQHTRIDSLDRAIFDKSTYLNTAIIFDNLKYFIQQNDCIELSIGYFNLKKYWDRCVKIICKNPVKLSERFKRDEICFLIDEYADIMKYFLSMIPDGNVNNIVFTRINQSLWAEREYCKNDKTIQCPKLGIIDNCLWICPNGDLDLCGYDDTQSELVYGNVFDGIVQSWIGNKRKKMIDLVLNNKITNYPCNNHSACAMYTGC